jgi:hypothetical protein
MFLDGTNHRSPGTFLHELNYFSGGKLSAWWNLVLLTGCEVMGLYDTTSANLTSVLRVKYTCSW